MEESVGWQGCNGSERSTQTTGWMSGGKEEVREWESRGGGGRMGGFEAQI